MIRVLLDQGLPVSAATLLRQEGWDAVHVSELGMARAEDSEILEKARLESHTCVTLDADFHALICASKAAQPSVIRLRIQGLRGPETAELIRKVVGRTANDLERGAIVSVTRSSLRVRHIPI